MKLRNKTKKKQSNQFELKGLDLLFVKGGTNGNGLDPVDRPSKTEK